MIRDNGDETYYIKIGSDPALRVDRSLVKGCPIFMSWDYLLELSRRPGKS